MSDFRSALAGVSDQKASTPLREQGERVQVSILMKSDDQYEYLKDTFPMLAAQTLQEHEVILIYSGKEKSSPTVELANRCGARFVPIEGEDFSHPAALNEGAKRARGEFLVCLSADAVPVSGRWLESLLSHFENPRVAATYGRHLPGRAANILDYFKDYLWYGPKRRTLAYEDGHGLSNANSALRRSLWEEHPFDDSLRRGVEDYEWALWAQTQGYVIVYEPEAAAYHSHGNPLALGRREYLRRALQFWQVRRSIDKEYGYPTPSPIPYLLAGAIFGLMLSQPLWQRLQASVSDTQLWLLLAGPIAGLIVVIWGLLRWLVTK